MCKKTSKLVDVFGLDANGVDWNSEPQDVIADIIAGKKVIRESNGISPVDPLLEHTRIIMENHIKTTLRREKMEKRIEELVKKIMELGKDNIPSIRTKRVNEALAIVAEIIPSIEDYVQDEIDKTMYEAKREVAALEEKV